jgi:pimeloyl-ACP methyl ester carboxylesterase
MTTWIFLRGLTRERRHWGRFTATFEREMPDARVVTLDLPGNGDLNQADSPLCVREMAAHCHAELGRLDLVRPCTVLAMSLGAMVAVAWADAYPEDIDRCVLINTSMRPFSPVHHRLRPRNYLSLLRLAITGGDARAHERTILRLTSQRHADDDAVIEDWTHIRETHPVSGRNALRQLLAAAHYRAPAQKPAVDLLLLASSGDTLVNAACSGAVAAAWRCELRRHPNAGHDLPLDDGEWVAKQVRQWIERRPPHYTSDPAAEARNRPGET